MRILIDMNLPPRWRMVFERAGHSAQHWAEVGSPSAPDRVIMQWARKNGYIVFTHDLDFSALLAATQETGPSVIQVRADDVLSDALADTVVRTLRQFEYEPKEGALLSVDPAEARVRVLPFGE